VWREHQTAQYQKSVKKIKMGVGGFTSFNSADAEKAFDNKMYNLSEFKIFIKLILGYFINPIET
jgi:hypothetical protein